MIDISPFIELGHRELAPYVSGVDDFILKVKADPDWEETSLRMKPPDVYIRNMLAIGVLNRINRKSFLETDFRIIVLPDCLKNYGDWTCCKENEGNESSCTQCNPDCQVYETVERFCNDRTIVVLEPDDMDVYFARARAKGGTVGVVGVACILTMLSGFDKTLKNRLPTQGVFLNYSSCAHHWANPAYNTSYSFSRMAAVLNGRQSELEYNQAEAYGTYPRGETYSRGETRSRGETYSLERLPLTPDNFYGKLDSLAEIFVMNYLPWFYEEYPETDIFALSNKIRGALVPDLITRDSA